MLTTQKPAKIQLANISKIGDLNVYTVTAETLKYLKSCKTTYTDNDDCLGEDLIDVEDLEQHLEDHWGMLSNEAHNEAKQINEILQKKSIAYLRLISE